MPDKEGAEEKTTKSVVSKRQKQMMGEEGYDVARDMGRVKPSKDKKDATSYPVSDEVKKTQKVNKGPSALERVKADIRKRGEKIMDVKKEELDLTKVAEAFGGYIVEKKELTIRDLMKQQGVPKGGVNPDISDANLETLNKRVSGQMSADAQDLNTVANRTKSGSQSRPKRSAPKITGDSESSTGGRDRAQVTFGQGKEPKKRAPKKGVDYFFDPKKAKAERERTVAKRKEYEIDPKGKTATDAGVEKFARKSLNRKQQASGSNLPIELSKSDLDTAREKLVGGKEVKDSKGNVVGTTTGKYGGRVAKQMSPKIIGNVEPEPKKIKKPIRDRNRVLQKVRVAARSTKRPVQRLVKPLGKLAARNPFAAAIIGTDLLDRAGRALPKPKPPKLDVGVVGRRTAG